jgi:hypothetical protein
MNFWSFLLVIAGLTLSYTGAGGLYIFLTNPQEIEYYIQSPVDREIFYKIFLSISSCCFIAGTWLLFSIWSSSIFN